MLTELVTSPFIPNDTEMGLQAGRIQVVTAVLVSETLTRVLQPHALGMPLLATGSCSSVCCSERLVCSH